MPNAPDESDALAPTPAGLTYRWLHHMMQDGDEQAIADIIEERNVLAALLLEVEQRAHGRADRIEEHVVLKVLFDLVMHARACLQALRDKR